MITPERIFIVAGAVVAVLLQLIVAPYIAVFSAMPNFMVVFAIVIAAVRPQNPSYLLSFLLGLAFDFVGGGPVGAMAFTLTLIAGLLAWYVAQAGIDAPFMEVALIILGLLLVELIYALFLLMFGYNANFFDAIAYRAAPCFIYDAIVSLLVYLVARRFVRPAVATRTDITQLR